MLILAESKLNSGGVSEAIQILEAVLKRTRGIDAVAECLANFHIGLALYKKGNEKERARAHLVEFQILS